MSRSVFHCPNCGPAIGTVLDDTACPIRCEHKLLGWHSLPVGIDKKTRQPIYEQVANTLQGCGGISRLCVHGLRACEVCPADKPPQFTPAPEPLLGYVSLAAIVAREKVESAHRRESEIRASRTVDAKSRTEQSAGPRRAYSSEGTAPAFVAPTGKVQLPFLGESEPTHYKPPRGGRKKKP